MIHGVEVFHSAGHELITTADALTIVLRHRTGGGNHFEIAPSPVSYPLLTMLVQDDFAILHFFGLPGDGGWQSRGNLHAVPDVVEFPDPAGSVLALPGVAVIDVITAERCVAAFAPSFARPEFVDWMRL